MDSKEIEKYLQEGDKARKSIDVEQMLQIGNELHKRLKEGKKVIFFGNGGNAANAQHMAAEFVGRFEKERRALPALALHTETSSVTAISQDYGYEFVFERQLRAHAVEGDIAVGLSVSGNSQNVVNALQAAKEIGCYTIGMAGSNGGKLNEIADVMIKVDSERIAIVQEVWTIIGHLLAKTVEDQF